MATHPHPDATTDRPRQLRRTARHWPDKREVLFAGENELPAMARRMIAEASPEIDPLALVVDALRAVAETRFEGRRADLRQRREIVRSEPGLG